MHVIGMGFKKPIHPLRQLRFALGDMTLVEFAGFFGTTDTAIRYAMKSGRWSDRLILRLAARFDFPISVAAAICDGSIAESDLADALEKAKAVFAETVVEVDVAENEEQGYHTPSGPVGDVPAGPRQREEKRKQI